MNSFTAVLMFVPVTRLPNSALAAERRASAAFSSLPTLVEPWSPSEHLGSEVDWGYTHGICQHPGIFRRPFRMYDELSNLFGSFTARAE